MKIYLKTKICFIILIAAILISLPIIYVQSANTTIPAHVYVDGNSNILIVEKPNDIPRPFIIKGLSWSPAAKAPKDGPNPLNPLQTIEYGFFFDWDGRNPQGHEVLTYWLKNQLSVNYLTDIPLIKKMNANTVRIYNSLGSHVENYDLIAPEIRKVLDALYNNGIMVIMTVALSREDFDSGRYLDVVNAYKDHPAILMWAIGNEWNFNNYFGETLDEAASAVNQTAQRIKVIDIHHPVSSVLGDAFDVDLPPGIWRVKDVIQRCPNVDIWGFNVYRGNSFANLFQQWKDLWELELIQPAKPLYLSEFGTDSYYSTSYTVVDGNKADNVSGFEDQQGQADVDVALWREIKNHLSSNIPGELCLGGLVFEFNDELWKVGNFNVGLGDLVDYDGPDNMPGTGDDDTSYDDYNNEGFILIGGHPDGVANDEYFGVVNADRQPKLAYEKISLEWYAPPLPDIKANNSDGHITIKPEEPLNITISLDPGSLINEPADFWAAAVTPFGIYWLTPSGWLRSDTPLRAYAGNLFNLLPLSILQMQGLPAGGYTFYFGVDKNMDGILNMESLYFDVVTVTIQGFPLVLNNTFFSLNNGMKIPVNLK